MFWPMDTEWKNPVIVHQSCKYNQNVHTKHFITSLKLSETDAQGHSSLSMSNLVMCTVRAVHSG